MVADHLAPAFFFPLFRRLPRFFQHLLQGLPLVWYAKVFWRKGGDWPNEPLVDGAGLQPRHEIVINLKDIVPSASVPFIGGIQIVDCC